MTGNRKRSGVVLQPRDLHILTELGVMRIIDREMTKRVAGFGSTTQVSLRLLELSRAGLLRRFFVGTVASGRKAIYTLSPKGSDLVRSELGGIHRPSGRLVTGDAFVAHQMAINEFYLLLKYPRQESDLRLLGWRSFREPISEAVKLSPDAYLEIAVGEAIRPMFLEVDLGTEALKVWQQKTAQYLHLAVSGEFAKRFGQAQFRVLVLANSERRLANIRSTIAKSTDKIFWFATLDAINREGISARIWLRPVGEESQTLL